MPNIEGAAAVANNYFPVPSRMVCKGDIVNNWDFLKQWEDYEVATGLDNIQDSFREILSSDFPKPQYSRS